MVEPGDDAIPYGMVEAVLTSPHLQELFSGKDTHEPTLRFVGQVVKHTRDVDFVTKIVAGALPENYGGNTLAEVPGMVRDAIDKGFAEPKGRAKRDEKISESFIKQVESTGIELFHTSQREAFISVRVDGGGRRCFPVRSENTQHLLRLQFFNASGGKPIAKETLNEVIDTLEAKALFEAPEQEVHLRIGGAGGDVFIDRGRADGSVVRITADGWSITPDCPIRFYRSPGLEALPDPVAGGHLDRLRDLLGLDARNWVLFLAFLLNCLKPDGPYMLLLVEGEQGSGKSVLCSVAKRIIDPNAIERLRLPKTEHDLMIQANENGLLVFDNASSMKWDISDALCSLATGSGFNTRKYYTDNESRTFKSCRPVIINGIGEFANRPDLLERCIQLKLPTMPAEGRRTERELWAEFDEMLPGILGCLYDAVAHALMFRDNVEPPTTVRMADAAQWLVAAEPALGFPPGTFLRALEAGQADMMTERAVSDALVVAIIEIVEKRDDKVFDDTMGKLLAELQAKADRHDRRLPSTPAHLSNALQRLRPVMARIGLIVEFGAKTRKGKLVRITLDGDVLRPAPEREPEF